MQTSKASWAEREALSSSKGPSQQGQLNKRVFISRFEWVGCDINNNHSAVFIAATPGTPHSFISCTTYKCGMDNIDGGNARERSHERQSDIEPPTPATSGEQQPTSQPMFAENRTDSLAIYQQQWHHISDTQSQQTAKGSHLVHHGQHHNLPEQHQQESRQRTSPLPRIGALAQGVHLPQHQAGRMEQPAQQSLLPGWPQQGPSCSSHIHHGAPGSPHTQIVADANRGDTVDASRWDCSVATISSHSTAPKTAAATTTTTTMSTSVVDAASSCATAYIGIPASAAEASAMHIASSVHEYYPGASTVASAIAQPTTPTTAAGIPSSISQPQLPPPLVFVPANIDRIMRTYADKSRRRSSNEGTRKGSRRSYETMVFHSRAPRKQRPPHTASSSASPSSGASQSQQQQQHRSPPTSHDPAMQNLPLTPIAQSARYHHSAGGDPSSRQESGTSSQPPTDSTVTSKSRLASLLHDPLPLYSRYSFGKEPERAYPKEETGTETSTSSTHYSQAPARHSFHASAHRQDVTEGYQALGQTVGMSETGGGSEHPVYLCSPPRLPLCQQAEAPLRSGVPPPAPLEIPSTPTPYTPEYSGYRLHLIGEIQKVRSELDQIEAEVDVLSTGASQPELQLPRFVEPNTKWAQCLCEDRWVTHLSGHNGLAA
ncbi:hypothetical protein GQ54DRAFT_305630 [Martensiomyces pterosporus]|nr:hypothetical protein GQ54DRAFT_305630 [Martensiomyces pterosporus]